MIRLLDLPGIARLEDRVFIYGAEDAEFEQRFSELV
jgi:hypothetical protein